MQPDYKRYTYLRKGKEIKKTIEPPKCHIDNCNKPINNKSSNKYCTYHSREYIKRSPKLYQTIHHTNICNGVTTYDHNGTVYTKCLRSVPKPLRLCFYPKT